MNKTETSLDFSGCHRFMVVLFDSASSPFTLSATLDHHLSSYNSQVSHDMKNNLYVDNIISVCESEEALLQYYAESRAIMGGAICIYYRPCNNFSLFMLLAD